MMRVCRSKRPFFISELINQMVCEKLNEGAEDLRAFRDWADEPVMSDEAFLQDLEVHGKSCISNGLQD